MRSAQSLPVRLRRRGTAARPRAGELEALDRSARFSAEALRLFQELQARLGVPTTRPILLPLDSRPFWHRTHHPLQLARTRPFGDARVSRDRACQHAKQIVAHSAMPHVGATSSRCWYADRPRAAVLAW